MNAYCKWIWGNKQSPTVVVKVHQIIYDVLDVTTCVRFCDVYNVFGLAGKRQHMELQLYLVAVQLEGGEEGKDVGFTPADMW